MPEPIAGIHGESLIPEKLKQMPGSEWGAPSAKAFVLRPQPQTIIEEPPPELNIPQFLPPDILDQIGKNWYTGEPGQKGTGKPQTFEEQQFVLDYLAQYGMKPEVGAGKELQQSGTYTPESTMGRGGFRTYQDYLNAQRVGEPFGPYAGGDVPQGGLVTTDIEGRPLNRYMDINRTEAQQALAEGRYINPLTGPQAESFQGGLPTSEKYYPSPMGEMPQLGMEEAIKQYGTPQMYLQGLSDYLDSQVRLDWPKVDAIYDQIEQYYNELQKKLQSGEITKDHYNLQSAEATKTFQSEVDKYMTEDKSKQEYARANAMVLQGTPIDQLPFLKEVSPTIWQMATEEQQRQLDPVAYEKDIRQQLQAGTITKEQAGSMLNAYQQNQPKPWGGYPEMEKGTQDIAGIINGLDTTPEYRRYLLNNIEYLRQIWEKSGEPDFYTWLLSYQGVR